jgi:hypothetical protein
MTTLESFLSLISDFGFRISGLDSAIRIPQSKICRGRIIWMLLFLMLSNRGGEAKTFEHVRTLPVKGTVAVRSESEEGAPGDGKVWSDSVQYAAQSVDYRFDEDTILFLGDAKIRYGKMTLTAEKITLRIQDDMIFAEGIPDSTGEPVGTPVFKEGAEVIRGLRMTYNIKTKKGTVRQSHRQTADFLCRRCPRILSPLRHPSHQKRPAFRHPDAPIRQQQLRRTLHPKRRLLYGDQ